MKLWDLSQSLEPGSTSPATTVSWVYSLPYGQSKHELFLDQTQSVPIEALRAELLYRILCHVLVDRLPGEALQETVEDIVDILRFYLPSPSQVKQLPTAVPRLQGRMTQAQPRKPLHFPAEE